MCAHKWRWKHTQNNFMFFASKHVSTSCILVPSLVICNNTDFTSDWSSCIWRHCNKEYCSQPTNLRSIKFEIYYQSGDDDRIRWTAGMVVYFGLFQLTDRNIGNSRDTTFEQLIMSETNGRGVDLVLNSLAEDKLQASVRCLAPGGRFLEIGKFDLDNNSRLGRLYFINFFH